MLALETTTRKRLVGLVNGMTRDSCLREDLTQEAMLCFWKEERERPGQTLSWYLQRCSFHLRHHLASGRSIDASKRRRLQVELPEDEDLCSRLACSHVENSVLAQVEVCEIIRLLASWLTWREQAVLQCLVEDLRPREIARHLSLSHPTVNKYRRRIAALAIRLGLAPLSPRPSRRRAVQCKLSAEAIHPQRHRVPELVEDPDNRPRPQRVEAGHLIRQTAEAPEFPPAAVTDPKTHGATRSGRLPLNSAAFLGFDPVAARNIVGFRASMALPRTVRDRPA
jgi:DNA-directed RNA polymerase specialized sigma24 family protein